MAGPVMVKSGLEAAEKKEMLMILYINSPNPDFFTDFYKDYVRCCTDTLSLVMSLTAQLDAGTQFARVSPLTSRST